MATDDLDDLLARARPTSAPDDLVARTLADAALLRAARPVPSDTLRARVARDAAREATRRRHQGWATWATLAAACAVGVAVGLAQPIGNPEDGYALGDLGAGYEFQIAGDY